MKNIIYILFFTFTFVYAEGSSFEDMDEVQLKQELLLMKSLITQNEDNDSFFALILKVSLSASIIALEENLKKQKAKSKKKLYKNNDSKYINDNIEVLVSEINSLKKELKKLKEKQDMIGRLSTSEDGAIMTLESN